MFDDLIRQATRQLLEVIELPGEGANAHRQRAQIDDEVVKLRLRQIGIDLVPALPALLRGEAEDLAAPTADEAMDARREIVGYGDLHRTDRLQKDRIALRHALAHGDAGRGLERH